MYSIYFIYQFSCFFLNYYLFICLFYLFFDFTYRDYRYDFSSESLQPGTPGGSGYSHTSVIYGCAVLMGGFLKKFAPMMGAFGGIPAPIMGTFLEILPPLGVKKMAIFLQNDPIVALYGWVLPKFCTYDWCLFSAEGARVVGRISVANS